MRLHAQRYIEDLYAAAGYTPYGEPFVEEVDVEGDRFAPALLLMGESGVAVEPARQFRAVDVGDVDAQHERSVERVLLADLDGGLRDRGMGPQILEHRAKISVPKIIGTKSDFAEHRVHVSCSDHSLTAMKNMQIVSFSVRLDDVDMGNPVLKTEVIQGQKVCSSRSGAALGLQRRGPSSAYAFVNDAGAQASQASVTSSRAMAFVRTVTLPVRIAGKICT